MRVVYCLAAAAALCRAAPAMAEPPVSVVAALDYAKPDESAAETMFSALAAADGKAVHLRLEIIPAQTEGSVGYGLTAISNAADGPVICGRDGFLGVVDNGKTDYELTLGHPENHHTQLSISIGDRRGFPFNSVICDIADYTENSYTPLKLDGHFVVAVGAIPTQTQIQLFPYNPK